MRIVILLLSLFFFHLSICQNTFHKLYGGDYKDEGQSITATNDGSYIATGQIVTYYTPTWTDSTRVYLVKADVFGDTIWTRIFNLGSFAYGTCVQQAFDGGFVVSGFCRENPQAFAKPFIIKTNDSGHEIWAKVYEFEKESIFTCIKQTADTGFILTGKLGDNYIGDVLLAKTDKNGDTLWTKIFGGKSFDIGECVNITSDSGYLIGGYTNSYGAGLSDFYLIKTNSYGDTIWTKTIGSVGYEWCSEIQELEDDGIIMIGTYSNGNGLSSIYAARTNNLGDTIWTRRYDFMLAGSGRSIHQTIDKGFIVGGYISETQNSWPYLYLLKMDSQGVPQWNKTFDEERSAAFSVRQTNDGGYIVTGYEVNPGHGNDLVLIKTNENGMVSSKGILAQNIFKAFVFPNPFTSSTIIKYTLSKPLILV